MLLTTKTSNLQPQHNLEKFDTLSKSFIYFFLNASCSGASCHSASFVQHAVISRVNVEGLSLPSKAKEKSVLYAPQTPPGGGTMQGICCSIRINNKGFSPFFKIVFLNSVEASGRDHLTSSNTICSSFTART